MENSRVTPEQIELLRQRTNRLIQLWHLAVDDEFHQAEDEFEYLSMNPFLIKALFDKIDEAFNIGFELGYDKRDSDMQEQR
jgi:hypothetical protein